MTFAALWTEAIHSLITRALDDEGVDPTAVRGFVIGPDDSYLALSVGVINQWENFPDRGKQVGTVPLDPWLDAVDALTPQGTARWALESPVQFADAAHTELFSRLMEDLFTSLVEALAAVAQKLAHRLPRPVGFFLIRPGREGTWVAVSDAKANLIMPVYADSESQWVALHDTGLTFFNEPDSNSDEELRGRLVEFTSIASASNDGDELTLTLTDGQAIESISGRSTQLRGDDYGLPESERVSAVINAHLSRIPRKTEGKAPFEGFEPEAFARWLTALGWRDRSEALKALLNDHPAARVIDAIHAAAKRQPDQLGAFADAADDVARELVAHGSFTEAHHALQPFDWKTGIARRAHVLWKLNLEAEFTALVAQAEALLKTKGLKGQDKQNAEFYRKELKPFEALMLGRANPSAGLAQASSLKGEEATAVRVLLNANLDVAAATKDLAKLLAGGYPPLALLSDVKTHPVLGAMIADYLRAKQQEADSQRAFAALTPVLVADPPVLGAQARERAAIETTPTGLEDLATSCLVGEQLSLAATSGLHVRHWPSMEPRQDTPVGRVRLVVPFGAGVVTAGDAGLTWVVAGSAGPTTASGQTSCLCANERFVVSADSKALSIFVPGPSHSLTLAASLALPSDGMNLTAIALSGDRLGISTYDRLYFVDCSDPRAPRPTLALKRNDSGFQALRVLGNRWLARDRGRLWLFDGSDSVRTIRSLSLEKSIDEQGDDLPLAVHGDWLWLGFGPRIAGWNLETGQTRIVDLEDSELEGGDLVFIDVKGTALTALASDGRALHATLSLEKPDPQLPAAFVSAVTAWVAKRLAQSEMPAQSLGALELGVYAERLVVGLYPTASLPTYLRLTRPPEVDEVDPSTLVSAEELAAAATLLEDEVTRATVTVAIAQRVAITNEFKHLAAGRTHLFHHDRHRLTCWAEHRSAVPWVPLRKPASYLARKRSPHEVLHETPWAERERLATKAKTDAGFRAAVFELAATGQTFSRRLVDELVELDPAGAATALLAAEAALASDALGEVQLVNEPEIERLEVIDSLYPLRSRPEVEARLEALGADARDEVAATALSVLRKPNDARLVERVRQALQATGDSFEADGWLADLLVDLPDEASKALRPDLEALLEQVDDDDAKLVVLEALANAGATELPDDFDEAQTEARAEENEDHFGMPTETPRALVIVRRFATSALLARLEAAPQATNAVWPEGFTPEPSHTSWFHFLNAATEQFEARRAWKPLADALLARLQPGDEFEVDRRLAIELALFWSARDIEAAEALVTAVLALPESLVSDDDESLRVTLRRRSTLARGWQLLKAGRLAEARADLLALVGDKPDGQVWFFEARMCWLEKNDPLAGIEVALKRLEQTSKLDQPGRGRLLNVIGCAYDALGKPAEALPFFERAVREGEPTGIYLANIAETLEKLGQLREARDYARRARRAGDTSELTRRLAASS